MAMKKKLLKTIVLLLSLTIILSLALSVTAFSLTSTAADNTWYYNKLNSEQKAYYTLLYNKLKNTYTNTKSWAVLQRIISF